jgi:hypothetical protein
LDDRVLMVEVFIGSQKPLKMDSPRLTTNGAKNRRGFRPVRFDSIASWGLSKRPMAGHGRRSLVS